MFRPLLLLPSPHKKLNELETRSASLTPCYREPIRPRLLLVWSMLIAGSCWSHAHANPVYSVTGVAVGTRVHFDSEAYQEYHCGPSQVFDGLTFCTKRTDDTEQRGPFVAYDGLLHSGDGTVLYVGFRRWRPNWFADGSLSSLRAEVSLRHSRPRQQPRRSLSPLSSPRTLSGLVLSPVSVGQVAT
jgi:hypothetical protein